jgi:hypothetical protein
MNLVRELTRWPDTTTEDCVLMNWFVEFNLKNIIVDPQPLRREARPTWLRSLPAPLGLKVVVR